MRLAPFNIESECKEFWAHTICDVDNLNSSCWKNDCTECKNGKVLHQRILAKKLHMEIKDESKLIWYAWETEKSLTKGGKPIVRQVKCMKEGLPNELIDLIMADYPSYVAHVRRKRILNKEFEQDKNEEENLIIQVDFAQDYNCQDNSKEIQAAIYGRRNVTLFTCAIHINGKWHSYAVVTDSDKYKSTVRQCMLRILQIGILLL